MKGSMKKIGIVTRKDSPEVTELLGGFVPWLKKNGAEVTLEPEVAQRLGEKGRSPEEMAQEVEAVIVLGGDGTMLGTARLMAPRGIPLMGVNLGGLGFITEVSKEEIFEAAGRLLTDECPSEERMMLAAHHLDAQGAKKGEYTALNDVVVNKGAPGRLIDLETTVGGRHVSLFRADGLIVCSPTGSTAYSLAAGGPIIHPTLNSMVLTSICPHTLGVRPLVLPEDVTVEITLISRSAGAVVTYDGLVGNDYVEGDTVVVKKAPYGATLLMPGDRDHFRVLRTKLGWGGR